MNNTTPTWPGWETVRLIGRGSFGAVYEIERDMLGEKEKAALKVITIPQNDSDISEMLSDGYDDESITSTFKEHLKSIVAEYSLMRKLNGSSYVVNCDDVRYVQHDDGIGWDIFIKMELLTPLTSTLPADVPEEQVVKIAKDICSALVQCKQFGIIHRDIKPQNIFASPLGDYKLGDFGIAKTVEKTSGGTKIGTYKYMAPEVYNNQPYGAGADIYSLGLVLYWLLNERRLPFLPLPPEKLRAGMEEEARLRRFNGEAIPAPALGAEELQRIVLKACAYDPKERYQSAEEMLREVEALSGKAAAPVINASVAHAETAEEDDGMGTIGVFGKSKNGATEDDATVRASKTDENDKNVNTEADDNTVGAFDRKEDQKIVQPAPASESKLEVKQKPKRKLWPVLAGIVVVAALFVALLQTGLISTITATTSPTSYPQIAPDQKYLLTQETITYSDGTKDVTTYQYNETGHRVRSETYRDGDEMIGTDTFTWEWSENENAEFEVQTMYRWSSLSGSIWRQYDDAGRIIREFHYAISNSGQNARKSIHDVGKVQEFEVSPVTGLVTGYTTDGNLVGHSVIGAQLIEEAAAVVGARSEVVQLLKHMVLAHHGDPSCGAAKEPATIEAELLHDLDLLDSRRQIYVENLALTPEGEFSPRVFALGRPIYHHTLARKDIYFS